MTQEESTKMFGKKGGGGIQGKRRGHNAKRNQWKRGQKENFGKKIIVGGGGGGHDATNETKVSNKKWEKINLWGGGGLGGWD